MEKQDEKQAQRIQKKAQRDECKEQISRIEANADILREHGINPNILIKLLSEAVVVLEFHLLMLGEKE